MCKSLNQQDLALLLGVSTRTIRTWGPLGLDAYRDPGTGSYDAPGAVQWRLSQIQEEAERESASSELQAARARKAKVEAERKELELGQLRGSLVPVDRVAGMVRKPLEDVDAALRSAPQRLARDVSVQLGVDRRAAHELVRTVAEAARGVLREVFEAKDGAADAA